MGESFLRKSAGGHKVQRDAAFAQFSVATLLSRRKELSALELQCHFRVPRDHVALGGNVILVRDGAGTVLAMSANSTVLGVARRADAATAAEVLDDLGGMLVGVVQNHSEIGDYFTVKCIEGGLDVEAGAGQEATPAGEDGAGCEEDHRSAGAAED